MLLDTSDLNWIKLSKNTKSDFKCNLYDLVDEIWKEDLQDGDGLIFPAFFPG